MLGFLISFFIAYPSSPAQMVRCAITGYMFLYILLGIMLGELLIKNKKYKQFIIIVVILASLSPLLFNLRILLAKTNNSFISYDTNELIVAKNINNIIPQKAVILTMRPVLVTDLWGRLVHFSPNRSYMLEDAFSEYFYNLVNEANLELIKFRGVDYIYYNPYFNEVFGRKLIDENKNNLEEIYNLDDKYIVYKIK